MGEAGTSRKAVQTTTSSSQSNIPGVNSLSCEVFMSVRALVYLLAVVAVFTAAVVELPAQVETPAYGFEIKVARQANDPTQFRVDVSITELATGQVIANPQLLGPANTDLTLRTDKNDYEYTVTTRADVSRALSSVEIRRSGNTVFRQQLTVAVQQ